MVNPLDMSDFIVWEIEKEDGSKRYIIASSEGWEFYIEDEMLEEGEAIATTCYLSDLMFGSKNIVLIDSRIKG